MDPYEVLNVSRDASIEEIDEAYRRMVKKHHPDVSEAENAVEKFKRIQRAYNEVSKADETEYESKGPDQQTGVVEGYPDGWRIAREKRDGNMVWKVFTEAETSPHVEEDMYIYLDEQASVSYDPVYFNTKSSAERRYREFSFIERETEKQDYKDTQATSPGETNDTDSYGRTRAGPVNTHRGEQDSKEQKESRRTAHQKSMGSGDVRGFLPSTNGLVPGLFSNFRKKMYRYLFILFSPFYLIMNAVVQTVLTMVNSRNRFGILIAYVFVSLGVLILGYGVVESLVVGMVGSVTYGLFASLFTGLHY
jgi:curved DNA-binding protein CbpA